MASNAFIGRKESIGVGIEGTPGTAVAAQAWLPHLALTLDPKTTVVSNNSAMGRVETNNDSVITEEWVDGSLNGKIYSSSFGYILANMFGAVSAALHSGETTVYDNTFTIAQTGAVPTLTFTRVNPVETKQFAFGMLTDLEIDIKQNDWVQFTATVTGKSGTTTTATAAYNSSEVDFSSKNVSLKFAANIAGLTGATVADIKSIKLKMSRKVERYTPLGGIDPTYFDPDAWDVTGTITARFTDHVLEDAAFANTPQAMSLSIIGTKVIGSAANPSLVFTMPKVRLDPQTLDNKLDTTLTQTFNLRGELDVVAGYMIQAVLTSTQNGYAHA